MLTRSRAINVTLTNVSGAPADIAIAEEIAPTTGFASFTNPAPFVLSDADGVHHVLVAIRDAAGNVRQLGQRTIVLDRAAPAATVTINSGAARTGNATVRVTINATDLSGLAAMAVANDAPPTIDPATPYASSFAWNLTPVAPGAARAP